MHDNSFQLQNATRITNAARLKLPAIAQANPIRPRQSFITADTAPPQKAMLFSSQVSRARF
jgi:hypothetical protein